MRRPHPLAEPALLASAALLALTAARGAHAADPLEKLKVAGWSKPDHRDHAPAVEPDKGFYKANGIDLAYVPGAGGGDAIRNILTGQADVAFTDPGAAFAALDKGEKLRASTTSTCRMSSPWPR